MAATGGYDTIRIAFAAALLALQDTDTGEPYFKFRPGTEWTYVHTADGKSSRAVLTVTKEQDGRVHVETKSYRADPEKPAVHEQVWYVEDGHVVWAAVREKQVEPQVRIYKIGSCKGDTWKDLAQSDTKSAVATHHGTEEVTVPAGTFKSATKVQVRVDRSALTLWLVPDVGMVRLETTDGVKTATSELKEFKPGK